MIRLITFILAATVLCLALLAGTPSDAEFDSLFAAQYAEFVCAGLWGDYHNLQPQCE